MGATGNSTGAHLHFGIKVDGKWIDPAPYLDADYVPDKPAEKTVTLGLHTLRKGSKGEDVRALQNIPVVNIAWPDVLFPLVLAWYIITELGSILENAIKLGANVPVWLVRILDASLKIVETAGQNAAKVDGNALAEEYTPPDIAKTE